MKFNRTRIHNRLFKTTDFQNKHLFQQLSNDLQKEQQKCSPDDCWCSHYDNPYDNYFYSHQLNPSQQYFAWIIEWKKQFKEIHEDCKKLGMSSFSNEYVRGVLDAVSFQYPINREVVDEVFEVPFFCENDFDDEI